MATKKMKHYTSLEKKIFLDILKDYKHIIEQKKSDSTTLKDKDVAWNEIEKIYNSSAMVQESRTAQQLKKLWSNLKQSQRDALTAERQNRLATGGGPYSATANIDPDIELIAPHLMATAPTLFSSNMSEKEIIEKGEILTEIVVNNNDITCLQLNNEISEEMEYTENSGNKQRAEESSSTNKENLIHIKKKEPRKRRRSESPDLENLKNQRIVMIMEEEKKLAQLKLENEKKLFNLNEKHLKEMNELHITHLKEIQNLEKQYYILKLKAAEEQLKREQNCDL